LIQINHLEIQLDLLVLIINYLIYYKKKRCGLLVYFGEFPHAKPPCFE